MAKVCYLAWVSGKVQGVFFRASTQTVALNLNLTGYAKNLDDGRVEVLACGDEQGVNALIEWLQKGPSKSQVDQVLSQPVNWQEVEGFDIL